MTHPSIATSIQWAPGQRSAEEWSRLILRKLGDLGSMGIPSSAIRIQWGARNPSCALACPRVILRSLGEPETPPVPQAVATILS